MRSKSISGILFVGMFAVLPQVAASSGPLDTWHPRDSKTEDQALNDIVYGTGLFVAVGSGGTIVTSTDGANWTPQNSGTTANIELIAYGSGIFLAMGVSSNPTYSIVRSDDGTNWTSSAWAPEGVYPMSGLAFANDRFFVLSDSFQENRRHAAVIFSSTDTTNWTRIDTRQLGVPYSVIYANSHYVALGEGPSVFPGCPGSIPFILTSGDAVTWNSSYLFSPLFCGMRFGGVAFGRNVFVAVFGAVGGGGIMSSPDGTSWTFRLSGLPVGHVAFGDGIFAAAGAEGLLVTSTDGLNWIARDPGTNYWLDGVAYGQNTFVVVGSQGIIIQSDPIVTLGLTPGVSTELSLSGPAGRNCEIQALDQLLLANTWQTIGTITLTNSAVSWIDADSRTNKPQRFYRAVLQP